MAGYREEPDVFGEPPRDTGMAAWKKASLTIAVVLGYMIPLFVLWTNTDYPDSLGVHITAHGKAGLIENWYYSYLLLERHHALDDLAFAYMWAPVVGFLGWLAVKQLRTMKVSIYSDDTE